MTAGSSVDIPGLKKNVKTALLRLAPRQALYLLGHLRLLREALAPRAVPPEFAATLEEVRALTNGCVAGGPFAGLRLPQRAHGAPLAPKLVGSYEHILHPWIEDIAKRPYELIVNIGAAEGYYAAGLALRLPHARVHAFDSDPAARRLCRATANMNGLSKRLSVGGYCSAPALERLIKGRRTLLMLDCEGCEKTLLDPAAAPALAQADILVELHDFLDTTITPTLRARFAASHSLRLVADRPLAYGRYPLLSRLSPKRRDLAVSELRPQGMCWAFLEANELANPGARA